MIYDNQKLKQILKDYAKEDPESAWHMKSRLNCWRFHKQLKECAKKIPMKAKVLDMGCGWGHTTAALKIMRPDIEIIGIDLQKRSLWEKLKEFEIEFKEGDVTKTGFEKEFDAVISFGVMEHVDDDLAMLKEIKKIMKTGGTSYMYNLPNKYSLNEFIARKLKMWNHDVKYTKKQVMAKYNKAGFWQVKIKKELLIPSQVNRISKILGWGFNKNYRIIDLIDRILTKTPLAILAQTHKIISTK